MVGGGYGARNGDLRLLERPGDSFTSWDPKFARVMGVEAKQLQYDAL